MDCLFKKGVGSSGFFFCKTSSNHKVRKVTEPDLGQERPKMAPKSDFTGFNKNLIRLCVLFCLNMRVLMAF